MKKTLRFAALTAVMGLTSWLVMGREAQANAPCSYLHGMSCPNENYWTYCNSGASICWCHGGHWDCGCVYDYDGSLMCPGE
jgi:hypothetical protein